MRTVYFGAMLAALAWDAGCSSSSNNGGGGGAGSAFTGTWRCDETGTVTTGGQTQSTIQARVLVITANGNGLSIEDHGQDGGGGNPCPTTASVSGVTATFTANQTCMSDDAGGGFTVASGTATVSGNMLAYDVSL